MKKKTKIFLSLFLFLGFSLITKINFANRSANESSVNISMGITQKNINNDIKCEKEVYDFYPDKNYYNLKYTLTNSKNEDVSTKFIIPFAPLYMPKEAPYIKDFKYKELDDNFKYSILVDGKACDYIVRYVYQDGISVLNDEHLNNLNDNNLSNSYLDLNQKIYRYELDIPKEVSYIEYDLNKDLNLGKNLITNLDIIIRNDEYKIFNDFDDVKENAKYIYFFDEKAADDFLLNSRLSDQNYSINVCDVKETKVFDVLRDTYTKYYKDIKDCDINNLFANYIKHYETLYNFNDLLGFNGGFSIVPLIEYDALIGANKSIINDITAPLYPSYDKRDNNYYTYSCLFNLKNSFKEINDLDINIYTSEYVNNLSLKGFSNRDGKFSNHLSNIPNEFNFSISQEKYIIPDRFEVTLFVFIYIVLIICFAPLLFVIGFIIDVIGRYYKDEKPYLASLSYIQMFICSLLALSIALSSLNVLYLNIYSTILAISIIILEIVKIILKKKFDFLILFSLIIPVISFILIGRSSKDLYFYGRYYYMLIIFGLTMYLVLFIQKIIDNIKTYNIVKKENKNFVNMN